MEINDKIYPEIFQNINRFYNYWNCSSVGSFTPQAPTLNNFYKPNIPIAIIEAKDNKHSVASGMQQAIEYADILQLPFVFSSNGDAFIFHDKTIKSGVIEKELSMDKFPSPETLWKSFLAEKEIVTEEEVSIVEQDYPFDTDGKTPRYYQQILTNVK